MGPLIEKEKKQSWKKTNQFIKLIARRFNKEGEAFLSLFTFAAAITCTTKTKKLWLLTDIVVIIVMITLTPLN